MTLPKNPLIYQVDFSGHEPSHYIKHEKQPAPYGNGMGYRIAVPNYGGFFADTLIVYDKDRNRLRPNFDYYATYRYEDATYRAGREIMGAIIVVGKAPVEEVYISAQFLGGAFATNEQLKVKAKIEDWFKEHPKSYPKWGEIIGEPSKYNTEEFKYQLWRYDSYEPTTLAMEDIYRTLILGRVGDIEDYSASFDKAEIKLQEELAAVKSNVVGHANLNDNPHEDTYTNVYGLRAELKNFPLALLSSENPWDNDASVVSPMFLNDVYNGAFGKRRLLDHSEDKNNPHHDHVHQMGGSTRQEINDIVNSFLGVDSTASDTTHVSGLSEDEIVEHAKKTLPTNRITQGTVKKTFLGYNECTKDTALTGSGMWVSLQTLFDRYKPTYTRITYLDSGDRFDSNGNINGNMNTDGPLRNYQKSRIPNNLGNNGVVVYAHNFSVNIWNGGYGLDGWFPPFIDFLGNHNKVIPGPKGEGWY